MAEEKAPPSKKSIDLTRLEKLDWDLFNLAVLIILVLTLFILISYFGEIYASSRELFKELRSVNFYIVASAILILMFCVYALNKNLEIRRLRKEYFSQKTALEQVTHTLEEVTSFFHISSAVILKKELPLILEIIARESLRCLRGSRSSIYLADGESGGLKNQITYAPNPLDENVNLLEEKEMARKVLRQNKPFLFGSPEDSATFLKDEEKKRRMNSLMCIPFAAKDKSIGVLSMVRINEDQSFNEENLRLLSLFGNHLSIAMENANLMEEASKKIRFRKDYGAYFQNILDLMQDLAEVERKEVEEHVLQLLRLQRDARETEKRAGAITLQGEAGIERRLDERIGEFLGVEFEDSLLAQTMNISKGGAFIRTPSPLEIEEQFLLKLHIPDGLDPLDVLCKVVWSNQYGEERKDLPRGMGVKFLGLQPDSIKRIEEFIRLQKEKKLSQEEGQSGSPDSVEDGGAEITPSP